MLGSEHKGVLSPVERTERWRVWRREEESLPIHSLKGRLWLEKDWWGRSRVVRDEDEKVGKDLLVMKGLRRSVREPGLYPSAVSYGKCQKMCL